MATRKPGPNEKVTCEACANLFPADAPACMSCKWPVDERPNTDQQLLGTLRRIARAVETIRYYMYVDRKEDGRDA